MIAVRWLFAAAVAVLACLLARPVAACKCGPPDTPEQAFEAADVVFLGVFTSGSGYRVDQDVSAFDVQYVYKGALRAGELVNIYTGTVSSCDLDFRAVGETWLIYAHDDRSGKLEAGNSCSRTRPVRYARQDLRALAQLGEGTDPPPPSAARCSVSDDHTPPLWAYVIAALALCGGRPRPRRRPAPDRRAESRSPAAD